MVETYVRADIESERFFWSKVKICHRYATRCRAERGSVCTNEITERWQRIAPSRRGTDDGVRARAPDGAHSGSTVRKRRVRIRIPRFVGGVLDVVGTTRKIPRSIE